MHNLRKTKGEIEGQRRELLKRRAAQGLPVREGEIEMMQSFMPEGMFVIATIGIITMAITYPRFKNG